MFRRTKSGKASGNLGIFNIEVVIGIRFENLDDPKAWSHGVIK